MQAPAAAPLIAHFGHAGAPVCHTYQQVAQPPAMQAPAAMPLTEQVGHADLHLAQLRHCLLDLAGDDVAAAGVAGQLDDALEPV